MYTKSLPEFQTFSPELGWTVDCRRFMFDGTYDLLGMLDIAEPASQRRLCNKCSEREKRCDNKDDFEDELWRRKVF